MSRSGRKPMLTPPEAAPDAGFEGGSEHRLPKPRAVGSNPIARSNKNTEGRGSPSRRWTTSNRCMIGAGPFHCAFRRPGDAREHPAEDQLVQRIHGVPVQDSQ